MADMENFDDLELIQSFTSESNDMLDEVEPQLIELQDIVDSGDGIDKEIINSIFRLYHTMKGSAGFLNFNRLASVTHEAETLLDLFRQNKAELTANNTDLLCRTCHLIRSLLETIETKRTDDSHEQETKTIVGELSSAIEAAKNSKSNSEGDSSTGQQPKEDQQGQADTNKNSPKKAKSSVKKSASGGKQSKPGNSNPKKTGTRKKSGKKSEDVEESEVDAIAREIEMSQQVTEKAANGDLQFSASPEMIEQFIQESDELLSNLEQNLLDYEENQEKEGPYLADAFRQIHSFKGNCGFLGYSDMDRLSHKTESVLECLKDNVPLRSDSPVELLLSVVDILKTALADVSNNGTGKIAALAGFISLLDEILPADSEGQKGGGGALGEILVARGDVSVDAVEEALDRQDMPLGEILVDMGHASEEVVAKALKDQGSDRTKDKSQIDPSKAPKTIKRRDIRVDVEKLDSLINLVGELIIAESLVTSNTDLKGLELENFERAAHGLKLITTDLQDVAMSVRMMPIAGTFRKMLRLVHDLAGKANKKVKLDLIGEETEVDKNVIELIGDPLVHIVRNSVDHGIDTSEERAALGKEETGRVTIQAKHEGGEVWIIISDDGRGLDRKKILAKAKETGLVNGSSDNMTDKEVYNLIFEPGFSTAEKVTDISGRGVGMDVVRKNIEKLKGHVDVHSELNKGTTISLRIPLTLAIIDGMMIRVGQKAFTIPIINIIEFFRPSRNMINILASGLEIVKLRDEILPIVRLHELYNTESEFTELDQGILGVIESRGSKLCLFIDEVLGQQQTVIKGLSDYVGNVKGISGCTILGNGDISLIIDVGTLFELATQGKEIKV